MKGRGENNKRAFVWSVLIGTFAGMTIQISVSPSPDPIDPSELWALPILVIGYGCLAAPFVALGLALFGLPAARALRRQADKWWIGVVAVVWGAAAGKLLFYAIDHLLFLGQNNIATVGPYDLGLISGVPTALAWWLLHRRDALSPGVRNGSKADIVFGLICRCKNTASPRSLAARHSKPC